MNPFRHPIYALEEMSKALKAYHTAFLVDNVKHKEYEDAFLEEMLHTAQHLDNLKQQFDLIRLRNESKSI